MGVSVKRGIPDELRDRTALLYDLAFGEKLGLAIPNAGERFKLLSKTMQLQYAIGAYADQQSAQHMGQQLVGLAGFSTSDGSLTGGVDYQGLLSEMGWLKGNRAAAVLSLYERKANPGELLMDGIVVDPDYRGKGIGSQLFAHLIEYGRAEHYATIRLDVVDSNPGARRLYERLGFSEEKTERFEFLRGILGFGASTTMIYRL